MTHNTHRYTTHATGRREKVTAGNVGTVAMMVIIAALCLICVL